jgi:RNA polymerase sigma-70 factor (ECF subfamily)
MSREIRERLGQALADLSGRQKEIFQLKHFEELSILEIAEITGLDSGTVKSHLFRAAHKIRSRLADFRKGK